MSRFPIDLQEEEDDAFFLVMGGLAFFGSLALGVLAVGVMVLLTLDVWVAPAAVTPVMVALAPIVTLAAATVEPTATPSEYRALLPVIAMMPTATPLPTATPAPSATPLPTWTAAPTTTPAAAPTSSGEWVFPTAFFPTPVFPTMTATAMPTVTPLPSATPLPTAIPLPTATLTGWWVERNGFVFASACACDQGDVLNCGDFGANRDAQACYLRCMELTGQDVHGLDRDNDGSACEWSW